MGKPQVTGERRRGWSPWHLAGLLAILAVGGGFGWWLATAEPPRVADGRAALSADATRAVMARRETRPTLDPAQFVGKARLAHQVAREIPDVLDQLYCYCECDKHMGHKSLLSCYTDGHAAT